MVIGDGTSTDVRTLQRPEPDLPVKTSPVVRDLSVPRLLAVDAGAVTWRFLLAWRREWEGLHRCR